MRLWFPNTPLAGISLLDRAQRAIGISRQVIGTETSPLDESYLRRYLDDPLDIGIDATPITPDTADENDAQVIYMRRYLDDPVEPTQAIYINNLSQVVLVNLVAGTGDYTGKNVCPIGTPAAGVPPAYHPDSGYSNDYNCGSDA